jgi:hypothetical protein
MPVDDRNYTDKEVAEILQKAMEADPTRAQAGSEGTSLAELKAIGAEVGIDLDRIEEAARSLALRPTSDVNPFLGAATAVDFEARVPGVIPPEATPEVLAAIRRITGKLGETSEIRETMEWRVEGDAGSRWVTVSPSDGHTIIRASARLGQGAVISFIPAAIAAIASAIPVLNAPSADGDPMALLLLPVVLAIYLTTRGLWSRFARKEADQLRQVVAELGKLAVSPDAASDPP